MIAFRADDEFRKQLDAIAENKGINLSALIKLYLKRAVKADLQEITMQGNTVAEALERTQKTEQTSISTNGGQVYHSAEEVIALLEKDSNQGKS